MKKLLRSFWAFAFVLTISVVSASAQIYVNVRPTIPVYTRVERPGPHHVWVDEEWVERNGRYEWAGGYWAEPPRPGVIWIGGFWRHGPRGDVWVRGHWGHRR